MRKSELYKKLTVQRLGNGHYKWTVTDNTGIYAKILTDSQIYDKHKSDKGLTVAEIRWIIKQVKEDK